MRAPRYTYIVVGAGSAGCILAGRLCEDPAVSVLLLEAGGGDRHWTMRVPAANKANFVPGSARNWNFHTTPQRHLDGRRIWQPRGKALGGSSSINGLVFLRGHPLDYERWESEDAAGWGYSLCLPYFKRLEAWQGPPSPYRGTRGPLAVCRQERLEPIYQAFLDAGRQAGFPFTEDVNGLQQEGFCRFDANIDNGTRASAARAYLRGARRRPNLHIATRALAHRVLIGADGARGVEYERAGRLRRAEAEREVLLACGAFGSPQLLMLSGVGPAEELRRHGIGVILDKCGVGENLQDHLEVELQHRSDRDVFLNRYLRPDRMLCAGLRWLGTRAGPAAWHQARAGAFLRSRPGVPHPDIQFHFFPVYFRGWEVRAANRGYRVSTGTLRGASTGTLRLACADPRAAPLIDPNYLATECDRREMREAFALARETLSQPAFRPYDRGESEPGRAVRSRGEIDAWIRSSAGSAFHPCGTCRMGSADDPGAVTDPQGRVHGIERLRIGDASLMPSIPSSNLNAVVMMMAEKIADHVRGAPALPPEHLPFRNAPHRRRAPGRSLAPD